MDDHEHVGEALDRYRTGELDEPDRLRVERHLETCAACRGELEALSAFARAVERGYAAERAARAAEREPDWAQLRAAVVARTSARTAGTRRARLGRYVPQAALAVLVLVAFGVLWEQGLRGPDEADRALRSVRRAGSRADGAAEGSGGPAATPGAERKRAAGDDRFAAADAPETRETTEVAPPAELRDQAGQRRRDVALDETGFRDGVDVADGEADADRAGRIGGAPAEHAEGLEEAVVPVEPAEERAAADARPDVARQEAQAQAREDLGKAAAAPPPELERFQTTARNALTEADTLLAARALAQWRDSLAPRQDLPPELARAARVLADSLAAFLAARP